MRVFVTGASGWIGSAAVDELLRAGHDITGLARSDASAAALEAKGVHVRRGDLDDLDSIRAGIEDVEAVIHLANKHDWSNPAASNAAERAAVRTIGEALAGSGRPFLLASGVAALAQGRPAAEGDASPFHGPDSPRGGSENLALEFVDRGGHTVSLRFAPTVHGTGDHGFIAYLAAIARRRGVSGYPGDGTNRWAAVHRGDAGHLVALGLAKALGGIPPARRRGGGHRDPRDSRRDRPRFRPARRLRRLRRRPGPLRMDRHVLRHGDVRVQRRDAGAPRLGANRSDPRRGPGCRRVRGAVTGPDAARSDPTHAHVGQSCAPFG